MGIYGDYIFPRVLNRFMSAGQFKKQRSKLLAGVSGDVLEIGFGTGLNLEFYPDGVRGITAVDPSAGMNRIAQRNIRRSNIDVDCRILSGERLPLEDSSFDSVVSTWTLCTIPDAAGALQEVKRVLRPSGRFFFVEHGLAPDAAVRKLTRKSAAFFAGQGKRTQSRKGAKKGTAKKGGMRGQTTLTREQQLALSGWQD